ncbi:unnamed protein product [Rangifer tarandus platyrhynchus]|uniref:Uncharacterized protein n=1 Tax=Rangifer tarandus platyrhynchus TaxID=3082113 RepID=A0AC59ZC10_RANTA
MGRGTNSEAEAADTGPPSRGWREERGASPPQPPPPPEAAPTFLRAQNAAWAARDSETLSALPSLRGPSPQLRRPVHPTPQRQLLAPVHPRGRPMFTSGRGRGAGSGGGAKPRRHRSARYGDAGGGGTLRAFPTRSHWPCVHDCSAQPDLRGAQAIHRLRRKNVTGGVKSRGLRAGGRAPAGGAGFWETSLTPDSPPTPWVLRLRPAWRAGVSPALPAVRPKLQKTVKKAVGEQDVRAFVRPLLSYVILKTVLLFGGGLSFCPAALSA